MALEIRLQSDRKRLILKIDANDLRRHYESLSDEEMKAINRSELTELARKVYEEEWTRRGLSRKREEIEEEPPEQEEIEMPEPGEAAVEDVGDGDLEVDSGPPPEWADDAAVACSFSMRQGDTHATEAARARTVLRAAGIPCCVTVLPDEGKDADPSVYFYSVMVPGALMLHATSVLDRDLFNPQQESDWRSHFEALSDKELRALNPDIFCAGLKDRVARLKRAYAEEIARRGLKK